jgi:hypothetical protein
LAHRRCRLAVASIIGTLATWRRRYRYPSFFAGNDQLAADFVWRFLIQPFREAEKLLNSQA